jgi:hypothetical protein
MVMRGHRDKSMIHELNRCDFVWALFLFALFCTFYSILCDDCSRIVHLIS